MTTRPCAAKRYGVILEGIPAQKQDVPFGRFDRVPKLVAAKSFGLGEYRVQCKPDRSFEVDLMACFDVDVRDFQNHRLSFRGFHSMGGSSSASAPEARADFRWSSLSISNR
jgi:hypothetical protein